MSVQYSLTYQDVLGAERTSYRLDILNDSYTGPITDLTGTDTPFIVEWPKADDPNRTIIGSKASINLWVKEYEQYIDFNSFPEYTFEVNLFQLADVPGTAVELTATSAFNRNSTRTNIPLNQDDRQVFFSTFVQGESYSEADFDLQTTISGTINGVSFPAGSTIRVNSSRISARGNFNFGAITSGATFNVTGAGTTESVLQWAGFINPVDGTENVTTLPFTVSFTATDQLGVLSGRPPFREPTGERLARPLRDVQRPIIEFIQSALLETGLGLDLYVDSGIRTASGDPLIVNTINEFAFYNQDQTSRRDAKEVVDLCLEPFNSHVVQGKGRWNIINKSNFGGTTDIVTWKTFTFDTDPTPDTYTVGPDVTENVRVNLTTGASADLGVYKEDIILSTLGAYGSVQANFPNLLNQNLIVNGTFTPNEDSSTPGFETLSTLPLVYSEDVFLSGGQGDESVQSIVTNVNSNTIDRSGIGGTDLWFRNTVTNSPIVSEDYPLEVGFDYLWNRTAGNTNNIKGYYQISIVYEDNFTVPDFSNAAGEINDGGLDDAGTSIIANRWLWNEVANYWQATALESIFLDEFLIPFENNTANQWSNVSKALPSITLGSTNADVFGGVNGRLQITFFQPEANFNDDTNDEGQGNTQLFIDNIDGNLVLEESEGMPVNERYQASYSDTLEYDPHLISTGTTNVYNRILGDENYNDDGTIGSGILASLEEVVTRQKLNDWRSRYKYYEGDFLHNNQRILTPIDKILVDYSWTDEEGIARTYIETASGIFTGGTWNSKQNNYDWVFNIPNQAPGLVSEFEQRNVELVAAAPPDRKPTFRYTLGFRGIGLDDTLTPYASGGDNLSLVPEGPRGINGNESYQFFEGNPLQEFPFEQIFLGGTIGSTNYQVTSVTDINITTALLADNVTDIRIERFNVNDIKVFGTLRLGNTTDFSIVEAVGEVDPLTANTVSFGVDVSTTDATGEIALATIPVSGEAGRPVTIQSIITPLQNRQLSTAGFQFTLDSILLNAGVTRSGNGLEWNITVMIPANGIAPTTNPRAVVTNITDEVASTTAAQLFTLNFNEVTGGVTNLGFATTSFPISGAPATPFTHFRRANAAPGFRANAGNDDTSSNHANAAVQDAIQDGDGYLIPVTGTIPTNGGNATITLDYTGTVPLIDADVVGTTVNFVTTDLVQASIDEPAPEVYVNGRNTVGTNTLLVIPDVGRRFTDADDVTAGQSGNVAIVSKMLNRDGSVSIKYRVTFGEEDSLTGNTITISGNSVVEPFLATVNVTETLPQGRLTTSTLTQNFNVTDTNVVFAGVTVAPNEGRMEYPSGITFVIVGGVATNYGYNTDGSVSFTLTVPLPAFTTANPIGNIPINVSITAANAPILAPANEGRFGDASLTVPLEGGIVRTTVFADGVTNVVSDIYTALGTTPGTSSADIAIFNVPEGAARSFSPQLRAGTTDTGTPLDGITIFRTSEARTTTFTVTNPANTTLNTGFFTVSGTPGQTFTRTLVISPTGLYEILSTTNFGVTMDSSLVADASATRANGQISIVLTFTIGTVDTDVTGAVTGAPTLILVPDAGATTSSITIGVNTDGLASGITHNFSPGLIPGEAETSQLLSFDVTPPVGQELLNFDAGAPGSTLIDNVMPGGSGSGNYNVTGRINFPPVGTVGAAIDIVLTGSLQEEPFLMTVDVISNRIINGKVRRGTFSTRFGPNDYHVVDGVRVGRFFTGTINVETINGTISFADATDITSAASDGGTTGTHDVNAFNNSILIPFSFQYPTLPQDTTRTVTLTGMVEPTVNTVSVSLNVGSSVSDSARVGTFGAMTLGGVPGETYTGQVTFNANTGNQFNNINNIVWSQTGGLGITFVRSALGSRYDLTYSFIFPAANATATVAGIGNSIGEPPLIVLSAGIPGVGDADGLYFIPEE